MTTDTPPLRSYRPLRPQIKVADATFQEVETAWLKLVGARSLEEAYEAYFDYLRRQNEVGAARAKSAASLVSAKASDAFDAFRDSATKIMPTWLRAA